MTQQEALRILKTGHNVYLTGAAGSGKTHLLNEYIRFLKNKKVGVGVTASTGIAATHLGGLTIHSWAGIGIARDMSNEEIRMAAANKRVAKRLTRSEVLIIDEISMLDADRLDLVDRVAKAVRGNDKPFGGIQVVLCGDFFQLPPVSKQGDAPPQFAYYASAWKQMDLRICYLHEQYRHKEEELSKVLNAIRQNKVDEAVASFLRAQCNEKLGKAPITKLYSRNVNVDEENFRELARLPGKTRDYAMDMRGVSVIVQALKKGCLAAETLMLKQGARVIFVKNNFEKGYVNGTVGTITGFDTFGHPLVTTLAGKKISASPETWSIEENGKTLAEIKQIPLRLAWAITIHKSQGMTIDAAEINLSDAFEKGMGYVALSRVRSFAGIKLTGFNEIALQVHPEILVFDNELKRYSEIATSDLHAGKFRENNTNLIEKSNSYSVAEIQKVHPSAYQKWSPEDEGKLVAGFKAGVAKKDLARMLSRNTGAIFSRLRKLGLIE